MPNNETPAYNLNKGYGSESNSQEKKDLMKDNPIARDASGSRPVGGSWMSKHSKSMGSPMKMNSPLNDFKGGLHKVQHAKGEAHQGSPTRMEGGKDQHQNIMNDKVTGPGGRPGGNSDADRWRKHQTSKHHSSPAKMMDDAAVKAPTNNLDKAKMTKAMAKGTKEAVAEKLAKKKKK
mgnify:CR=1 FL=1